MTLYDLMWVPFSFVASIFPPVYQQSRLGDLWGSAQLGVDWMLGVGNAKKGGPGKVGDAGGGEQLAGGGVVGREQGSEVLIWAPHLPDVGRGRVRQRRCSWELGRLEVVQQPASADRAQCAGLESQLWVFPALSLSFPP